MYGIVQHARVGAACMCANSHAGPRREPGGRRREGARRSPATRRKRGSGGRAERDVDLVAVGVVFSEAGRVRS